MKKVLATAILLFPLFLNAQNHFEHMDSIRQAHRIIGWSAAIITPDTILRDWGGSTRSDSMIPIQEDHYWHLGSNTKAMTAQYIQHALMVSEESLEVKFFDVFPNLKRTSKEAYYDITLQDLLSHRAGIPPFTAGLEFKSLPELKGPLFMKRWQFARHVLGMEPKFPDSKKKELYVYSNAGYVLAAMMLEGISGFSFETFLEKSRWNDKKVKSFIGLPNRMSADQPWGHFGGDSTAYEPLNPNHSYNLPAYMAPAGGVSQTMGDYALFVQEQLDALVHEDPLYQMAHFGLEEYSLGWRHGEMEVGGSKTYYSGHDGSLGCFYTHTIIYPAKKLAVVVCANSGEANTVNGIYALRAYLTEAYLSR
ncbi:MAG: serine hydrolase domain-containing protein [Bacteroidota bacterium]